MSDLIDRVSTKRLMAYSAAAGLGAFAFGQSADAVVQVNKALDGVNISHSGVPGSDFTTDFDIDGDGNNDVRLLNGLNGIGLTGFPGNAVLSKFLATDPDPQCCGPASLDGLDYYVTGFTNGSTVDALNMQAGGGINLAFVSVYVKINGGFANPPGYGYTYELPHTDDGEWMGVQFQIGPNTHFGAIQVKQDSGTGPLDLDADGNRFVGDVSTNPVNMTFGDMIWETTPGATLVIPEPASLGLLAAGAGALGLRRRRQA